MSGHTSQYMPSEGQQPSGFTEEFCKQCYAPLVEVVETFCPACGAELPAQFSESKPE